MFFFLEFVDSCSRGRADARKKQWSTGNFHILVRHFLSRVPLYFSLAKIQKALSQEVILTLAVLVNVVAIKCSGSGREHV